MQLLEKIISVIAPHTCLGCGVEDDLLLCEGCQQSLALVPSRCYRCKAVTPRYEVCKPCQAGTPLRQVVVFAHHSELAKELIHHMKYERARAGMAEAATLMSELVWQLPTHAIYTHIPTASSRVRIRGYDHAKVLARCLALPGTAVRATLLARLGQAHQVGSSRAERLRQLQDSFRPVHARRLQGRHVVLVDDVLTTGATLETAARTLKRAGAKRVSAIVFAQA
jgi:ComF family protein